MSLLKVRNLSRNFGGVLAVDSVCLDVADAQIFGLIGANGAGKTTLFNVITGYLSASSGHVTLNGQDITSQPAYKRVRLGIGRSFQTPQLLGGTSVRDNVMSGTWSARLAMTASQRGRFRSIDLDPIRRCDALLRLFGLEQAADAPAAGLAYGLQKKLEIARAMMTNPRILMLDEPAAGMLPSEVDELNGLIRRIRDEGCAVVLVEHNMRVVMNVSDEVAVMEFGKIIATGSPTQVRNDPDVIRAYLGEHH
jgi:branched-chain amino acid transport system ATP-binding protein